MYEVIKTNNVSTTHPKCKGIFTMAWIPEDDRYGGSECEYYSKLSCSQCKYGKDGGRKDPEAKCNQQE